MTTLIIEDEPLWKTKLELMLDELGVQIIGEAIDDKRSAGMLVDA